MTCDFIKEKLESGAVLVDVRTPEEYQSGRLKEATNVPLATFETAIYDFEKGKELLLYCRSGARSQMATNYLNSLGFSAKNIGGINQFIGCIEY